MKTEKVCLFIVLAIILRFLSSCGQTPLMSVRGETDSGSQQTPSTAENNLNLRFIRANNEEVANIEFNIVCNDLFKTSYDHTSSLIVGRDKGNVIFRNIKNGNYQITITNPNYQLVLIKKNIDGHEESVTTLTPCTEPGTEKYFIVVRPA